MSQDIIIDVRIAKYGDPKARMIANYDSRNAVLSIDRLLPYELPKDPYKNKTPEQIEMLKDLARHTLKVVDNPSIAKWDLYFQEREHITFAISAYYELIRSNSLLLGEEIKSQFSMDDVIQVRTIDASKGSVYELNPDSVECGHVAILAACWAALRAGGSASLIEESEADPTQEQIDDFLVPFTI